MNIAFLTLVYPASPVDRNLYTDLMDELALRGNEVTVFCPDEARCLGSPSPQKRGMVTVIRIPTGRITKTTYLRKAVNTSMLGFRFLKAVLGSKVGKIDLLVYSTPPITFSWAVEAIKKDTDCHAYLLLKDIFPQNAVDLGIIRKNGIAWSYFRAKEKRLYRVSDSIGCMSPANAGYCLRHNPSLEAGRVHVCPNSIRPTPPGEIPPKDGLVLRELGIEKARLNLIYGGNLGKPQGVGFILETLARLRDDHRMHMTIVGDGTEYGRLEREMARSGRSNAVLMHSLPKQKYRELLANMDVGLVFLDGKFTIPNYPSRMLDYMDFSLPVIAATDKVTDIRQLIEEEDMGFWCESGDVEGMYAAMRRLLEDAEGRKRMAARSRLVLERRFDVKVSADAILGSIRRHLS